MFFRNTPAATYDMIFYDLFSGVFVPFHTTTLEAFAEVKKSLKPDGVFVMNAVDGNDTHSQRFVASLKLTLEKVFRHVLVKEVKYDKWNGSLTSFSVQASDALLTELAEPVRLTAIASIAPWSPNAQTSQNALVLKDNYAPVESMIFAAVR